MPGEIDVSALREMLARGTVQLIEVLPQDEYDEEHIPGALSIPLRSLTAESVARLDRTAPTVVYCWDDT
ncbi:MAG: rhodanese-like domain-containing protein [Actinomycetota bacterium]|nr:rhodanese-like domain-containing protein [Actinomycetota bacterium]